MSGGVRPARVGFVGVGWIGRNRMAAMLETGAVQPIGVVEPAEESAREAMALAPKARRLASLEELLDLRPEGVVIATPSALHAAQAVAALEAGAAVFCQKPLGRTQHEAAQVVGAARRADRLLQVDLSYRRTAAMQAISRAVREGQLGRVFAVDLTFHNAYGPDKAWFYDPVLAGGGCLMDLGVHLVDLALWVLGYPQVVEASGALARGGAAWRGPDDGVEDFATASLRLAGGCIVRVTTSWRLHAGQDAEISAAFYGENGGMRMRNLNGSFYDFVAERLLGCRTETLVSPPDAWGGRAAAAWARRLATAPGFDPEAEDLVALAAGLDAIYSAATASAGRLTPVAAA
ncbi:MAG: Gfo/Idh/MocA family protein [Phenylobacterium sp.]|uniref:Gfo/Idh/MocA family protein n=1 Tax=Phenylobacterium sp. TaxID=1871053 RepID=UPI00391CDC38